MITTRFGTPVILVSPIDPITGWVKVLANLGLNGTAEKEVDVLDLRADGGYDEIQAASDALLPQATAESEAPEHVKGDDAIDRYLAREFWPKDNEWDNGKSASEY